MSRLDDYNARRRLEAKRPKRARMPAEHRDDKVTGQPCRMCRRDHGIEAHHIVPRSKFGKRDDRVHDRDNLMPLCHDCHQNHHTTDKRVPHNRLTGAEIAFIQSTAGTAWMERWYPC